MNRIHRKLRRLARIAALALLGAAVLYLVGMNAFLGTHAFRDLISSDPDSLLVEYDRAYSLWPGRIHVEGLSIRGRDGNVEWILRLERCDFRVAFTDLARKKFHAHHVRGDGLRMRARQRVDAVTPATMAALPPVPGFLDPPLADIGPPTAPLTDANYHLWSVELDDVVASHVHEIWIDTQRYSGDLEVRGRWVFRPMRRLDIGPATADARTLDVGFGMVESWADGLAGHLGVRMFPVDLQAIRGAQLIDSVSVEGDLRGTLQLATAVNRMMEGKTEGKSVKVDRASTTFALTLDIDHGALGRGTQLQLDPFDAQAEAAGLDVAGSLQAELHVDETGEGRADLRAASARVSAGGYEEARAVDLALSLSSRELHLTHAFSDATFVLDATGAETHTLEAWSSRLAPTSKLRIASGTLTAGGRLAGAVAGGPMSGHAAFQVRELSLADGNLAGLGNLDGEVQVRGLDLTKHDLAGVVDLTAEHATMHMGGATLQSGVRVHAAVADGHWGPLRADLAPSSMSLVDARATVKGVSFDVPSFAVRAGELVLRPSGLTGTVSVDVPRIALRSLATLAALVPLPDDVVIDGGSAAASLHLDVDLARLVGSGEARIVARDVRMRMGARSMPGELVVALHASEHGDRTDLSGSSISFKGAGTPGTLDWWGQVHLRQTTLRVRPRLLFETSVTAEAKDASPWTALVASSTPIPQWALNLVSTAQFEVTGDVLATPSVFAARSVKADAEGADVRFELAKTPATTGWAMLLDLGALVGGVGVADGKTQVLLFGARPWFQERTARLQSEGRRNE
jgi:hypothetical protein